VCGGAELYASFIPKQIFTWESRAYIFGNPNKGICVNIPDNMRGFIIAQIYWVMENNMPVK
jgi:hypothetical protein